MISRACPCGGITREGKCNRCKPKPKDSFRGNSAERGYDWEWRKFSEAYRQQNPICADCESDGRTRLAQEVHHKIRLSVRPDLKYEPTNLMGLCSECHSKRTARGE